MILKSRLNRFIIILSIVSLWLCAAAAQSFASVPAPGRAQDDTAGPLTVSLVTCWPGADIYELDGHGALRVRGEGIDSVWNWGTFDFDQPNFVYRFVRGETDYMLTSYPFSWFMPEYMATGRKVLEQDLNLTDAEAHRLLEILRREALPANRTYRYNYVKDNCVTRITDRIAEATGKKVLFPDTVAYGTFRKEMTAFHRDYPWYQFGIDIALGSGLDYQLNPDEEMFVPLVLSERAEKARFPDGRPLVKQTRVLWPGVPDATLGPTPWWLSPMFWSIIMFLFTIGVCIRDGKRRRLSRWWWSILFGMAGIAGCVVTFLVFFSSHEATSPNTLIFWLNPLQLLAAVTVWWPRRLRGFTLGMAWYNIVVVGIMLLVWPFQPRGGNPAFFPLMASCIAMGVTYAIIRPGNEFSNKPAGRRKSYVLKGSGRQSGASRPSTRNSKRR